MAKKDIFKNPVTKRLEVKADEVDKKNGEGGNSSPLDEGRGPIRTEDTPQKKQTPTLEQDGKKYVLNEAEIDRIFLSGDELRAKYTKEEYIKPAPKKEPKKEERKTAQEKRLDRYMRLGRISPREVLLMGKGPINPDKATIRRTNYKTGTNLGERAGLELIDNTIENYVDIMERDHTFTEEENAKNEIDSAILNYKKISPEGYAKHRDAIDKRVRYAMDKDSRLGVRGHNKFGVSIEKYNESIKKGDIKAADEAKKAAWADIQYIKERAPKYYAENAAELLAIYSGILSSDEIVNSSQTMSDSVYDLIWTPEMQAEYDKNAKEMAAIKKSGSEWVYDSRIRGFRNTVTNETLSPDQYNALAEEEKVAPEQKERYAELARKNAELEIVRSNAEDTRGLVDYVISREYELAKFRDEYGNEWYNGTGELPSNATVSKVYIDAYTKMVTDETNRNTSPMNYGASDAIVYKFGETYQKAQEGKATKEDLDILIKYYYGDEAKINDVDLSRLNIMYKKENKGWEEYLSSILKPRFNLAREEATAAHYKDIEENGGVFSKIGARGAGLLESVLYSPFAAAESAISAIDSNFKKSELPVYKEHRGYGLFSSLKSGTDAGRSSLATAQNADVLEFLGMDKEEAKKWGSGIYSVTNGIAENLLRAPMGGTMAGVMMFSQSFASEYKSGVDSYRDPAKNTAMAITSAVSEGLTEKIEIGALGKALGKTRFEPNAFRRMWKASVLSGGNEILGELSNDAVRYISDYALNGDESELAKEARQLVADGKASDMSNAVIGILIKNGVNTAVVSYISGSVLGGVGGLANYIDPSAVRRDGEKLINSGADINEIIRLGKTSTNNETRELALNLENAISGGNKPDGFDVQLLYSGVLNDAADNKIDVGEVVNFVSNLPAMEEASPVELAAESAIDSAISEVVKANSEGDIVPESNKVVPSSKKNPFVEVRTDNGKTVSVAGEYATKVQGRRVYVVKGRDIGAQQAYYAIDSTTGLSLAAGETKSVINKQLKELKASGKVVEPATFEDGTENIFAGEVTVPIDFDSLERPVALAKPKYKMFEGTDIEDIFSVEDDGVSAVETAGSVGEVDADGGDVGFDADEEVTESGDGGKKSTVTLIGANGLETYEGVSVAEDTGYDLTAVERNGGITIVEKRSGMEFAHGATVEEAVANVRNKIAENGKEAVDTAVEKTIERRKARIEASAGSTSPIEGDRLSVGRAVADADYTNTLLEMAKTSKNEKARKAAALYSSYDFRDESERYRALGDIAKILGVSEADLVKSRARALYAKINASISGETNIVDKLDSKLYEERKAAVDRGDTATVKAIDYLVNVLNSEGGIISVSEMFAPNQYSAENPNVAVQVYGKRMETAFKNIGLDISVSVYYDSSENAARGEWTKHPDGHSTIRLNGAKLQGEQSAFWVVSHELIHEAESKSPGITQRMLDAFTKMGMYDESQYEAYKARYSKKCEADFKKALDRGDVTQDDHDEFVRNYVNEEIVADLMSETMSSSELVEVFAGKLGKDDSNVIVSFLKWIKNGIKKVFNSKDEFPNKFSDIIGMFEGAVKGTDTKSSDIEVTKKSFAGKKANSADLSLLEQARDMENNGRNADEILKETGWYKGADGEWRFEIDDSKMEVNTSGKFTRDPEKRRYIELFDKVFLGTDASEQEVSELYELDKKLGKESFTPTKLGDLIKHPDLFKAYPELEDVNIAFVNTNENFDGAYDPILNGIILERRNNIAPERLKGVLIHEIQHAIQKIENFARGASTEYWQAEIDARREDGSRSAHDLYKNTAGEIEAREAENRKNLSAEERRERMPFVKDDNTVFTESSESNGGPSFSEERLDNVEDSWYNKNTNNSNDYNVEGGITNGNEDEFRRIQEEARKEFARSDKEQRIYAKDNEALRKRLARVLSRRLDDSGYNSGSDLALHLKSDKQNTEFLMYENVDAETFYEIFEIARAFTENGELVDLHDIKTTNDGIGYEDCKNFISDDGLSGFSITPAGDLISVFNAGNKRGFLSAISDVVKKEAKTLDCYASPKQDLMTMYEKKFGFKTASIMDYNMEYDHDDIAKNHEKPNVAFMVNTSEDIETKHFGKDEYDEAVAYRDYFIQRSNNSQLYDSARDYNESTDTEYLELAKNPEKTDTRYSLTDTGVYSLEASNKFTYDSLVSLPDMKVTKVSDGIPKKADGKLDRAKVKLEAMNNAFSVGEKVNGSLALVENRYTGKKIAVRPSAIGHGLDRRTNIAVVSGKIGELLRNALRVNEMSPRDNIANVNRSYPMITFASDDNDAKYAVLLIINDIEGRNPELVGLSVSESLYSVNAKKEESAVHSTRGPDAKNAEQSLTDSNISIADLLSFVKDYFPDILSDDVLSHFGMIKNGDSDYEGVRYSLTDTGVYSLEDAWAEKVKKYGAIPKGEKAARDIKVPKKISDNKYVSRTARSAIEAGITPAEFVPELQKEILDGKFTYERFPDDKAEAKAKETIEYHGFEGALEHWEFLMHSGGAISKENFSLGIALYNQCAQNGDFARAEKILADLSVEATRAGQAIQSMRLLKKMSADGTMYYLEKSIDKINDELVEKFGEKRAKKVEINDELARQYFAEKDAKKREKLYDELCKDIGEQIPSTFWEKADAWRYVAMLFNPTTHIRNVAGNIFNKFVIMADHAVEGALQPILVKRENRTRTWRIADKKTADFAKNDWELMRGVLTSGEGKYNNMMSDIDKNRRILRPARQSSTGLFDNTAKTELFSWDSGLTDDIDDGIIDKGKQFDNEVNGLGQEDGLQQGSGDRGSDKGAYSGDDGQGVQRVSETSNSRTEKNKFGNIYERSGKVRGYLKEYGISGSNNGDKNAESGKYVHAKKFIDNFSRAGFDVVNIGDSVYAYKKYTNDISGKHFEYLDNFDKIARTLGITVHYAENMIFNYNEGYVQKKYAFRTGDNIFLNVAVLDEVQGEDILSHELFHYIFDNYPELADSFIDTVLNNRNRDNDALFGDFLQGLCNLYGFDDVYSDKSLNKLTNEMMAYVVGCLEGQSERASNIRSLFNNQEDIKAAWNGLVKKVIEEQNTRELEQNDSQNGFDSWDDFGKRRAFADTGKVRKAVGNAIGFIPEVLRKFNSWGLEAEDAIFLGASYKSALRKIITARKLNVDNITPEQLSEIRDLAIKDALRATFREANWLAESISRAKSNLMKGNAGQKAAGIALGGLFPFTKTPMNITKQALEHSPLSLFKVASDIVKKASGKAVSGNDIIADLARTFTGTGLTVLGFVLAKAGFVSAGDDEDPDKKRFDKLVGEQSYAITVGGKSYTIDWATPASIPFLVGAQLFDATSDSGINIKTAMDSLTKIAEPVIGLSMLDGLRDFMQSDNYAEGQNPLFAGAYSTLESYVLQFFPTLGGKIHRIYDGEKKNYYFVDKNGNVPEFVQELYGSVASKLPFAVGNFQPSVDLWGRVENHGGIGERLAENLISPGYYSEENYTEVDEELLRLYESTGNGDVFPKKMYEDITIDGHKYYMNAEHYTEAAVMLGERRFDMLSRLFNDEIVLEKQDVPYSEMSDSEKAKIVSDVYYQALDETKYAMFDKVRENSARYGDVPELDSEAKIRIGAENAEIFYKGDPTGENAYNYEIYSRANDFLKKTDKILADADLSDEEQKKAEAAILEYANAFPFEGTRGGELAAAFYDKIYNNGDPKFEIEYGDIFSKYSEYIDVDATIDGKKYKENLSVGDYLELSTNIAAAEEILRITMFGTESDVSTYALPLMEQYKNEPWMQIVKAASENIPKKDEDKAAFYKSVMSDVRNGIKNSYDVKYIKEASSGNDTVDRLAISKDMSDKAYSAAPDGTTGAQRVYWTQKYNFADQAYKAIQGDKSSNKAGYIKDLETLSEKYDGKLSRGDKLIAENYDKAGNDDVFYTGAESYVLEKSKDGIKYEMPMSYHDYKSMTKYMDDAKEYAALYVFGNDSDKSGASKIRNQNGSMKTWVADGLKATNSAMKGNYDLYKKGKLSADEYNAIYYKTLVGKIKSEIRADYRESYFKKRK